MVVEHNDRRPLLGPNRAVTAEALGELSPALAITHICGNVDRESLEAAGFPLAPERFAPAGHMSVALDHVGPRPVVDLHAAGLKVGELLAAARERGLGGLDAEAAVLEESGLAQGFPQEPDGSCPPAKGRHP